MGCEFNIAVTIMAPDDATLHDARISVKKTFGNCIFPESSWSGENTFCCEMSSRIGDERSIRGFIRHCSTELPSTYFLVSWSLTSACLLDAGEFMMLAGKEVYESHISCDEMDRLNGIDPEDTPDWLESSGQV